MASRTESDTTTAPNDEATRLLALAPEPPWTAWVTVSVDGDQTTLRRTRPLTLNEELRVEIEQDWKNLSASAFPLGRPTNIDEYRARFDPEAAMEFAMQRSGLTQAEIAAIPPTGKVALTVFVRLALEAIWYNHGKIPR